MIPPDVLLGRVPDVADDDEWPLPEVRLEPSAYGLAVEAEPFEELLGRLSVEARNYTVFVAIEMLLPIWDAWVSDWREPLDACAGLRVQPLHEPLSSREIEAAVRWPRRLLTALGQWFDSTPDAPFRWGFRLTDHFNVFREVLYGIHRSGTPELRHARHPVGWYASLQQGEALWGVFGWFAQALDHDARDNLTEERYHQLTINRVRNGLASVARVFGWRTVVQALIVARRENPDDRRGTLGDHEEHELAKTRGLEDARGFYTRWWSICRARLAFRDAPTAEFTPDFADASIYTIRAS